MYIKLTVRPASQKIPVFCKTQHCTTAHQWASLNPIQAHPTMPCVCWAYAASTHSTPSVTPLPTDVADESTLILCATCPVHLTLIYRIDLTLLDQLHTVYCKTARALTHTLTRTNTRTLACTHTHIHARGHSRTLTHSLTHARARAHTHTHTHTVILVQVFRDVTLCCCAKGF